jgi:hypothetical protein
VLSIITEIDKVGKRVTFLLATGFSGYWLFLGDFLKV